MISKMTKLSNIIDRQILEQAITDQHARLQKSTSSLVVPRALSLEKYINRKDITIITGIRRSGKSSLLKQVAKDYSANFPILYLSFEDPRLDGFDKSHFSLVHEIWQKNFNAREKKGILIFDEIQNVDGWEKWVNYFAQEEGHKVFITGSNATLLASELATFLTGRHTSIQLFPFSYQEIKDYLLPGISLTKPLSTDDRIELLRLFDRYNLNGSFPRAFLDEDTEILADYYRDIVIRDISRRKNIKNSKILFSLGSILMRDRTRLFNRSRTAKAIGLKQARTINNYCHSFEETFLVFEVKKFDRSLRNQTRSLSKFYVTDNAFARTVSISTISQAGADLENHVFMELKRRGFSPYYWISPSGYEVDFIIETSKGLEAIQVCYSINSSDTELREIRSLRECKKLLKIASSTIVTYNDSKLINQEGMKVKAIPFYEWALTP